MRVDLAPDLLIEQREQKEKQKQGYASCLLRKVHAR